MAAVHFDVYVKRVTLFIKKLITQEEQNVGS